MNENNYYQFNLNFHGDYIRGYLKAENDDFFIIETPLGCFLGSNANFTIKSTDDQICLLKRQVVCYYKVHKNQPL